jgi:hypothetical protein
MTLNNMTLMIMPLANEGGWIRTLEIRILK